MRKWLALLFISANAFAIGSSNIGVYPSDPPFNISLTDGSTGVDIGPLLLRNGSTGNALSTEIRDNQVDGDQRVQLINSDKSEIGQLILQSNTTGNNLATQIRDNQSNNTQKSQLINPSGTDVGSLILANSSTGVSNQVNGTQRAQLVNANNAEIGQLNLEANSTGNNLLTQVRNNQSNNTQKSQLINPSGTDLGSILVLDGTTGNSLSTQIRNNQTNNTQKSQLINPSGTDVGSLILQNTSTGVSNQTNGTQRSILVNSSNGAADFGAGTTGATTLRTTANLSDGSANAISSRSYSTARPLDVYLTQLSASTSTATQVTPTANVSTQLLAANATRKWAMIINNSGAKFYLNYGGTAVINQGILVDNGTTLNMSATMLFTGAINGIVGSNGRTIDIIEGQ